MKEQFSLSLNLDGENMDTFKKMLGIDISERYQKGEETEEDLLENHSHMHIIYTDSKGKHELDVVKYKYYQKLVDIAKKYKHLYQQTLEVN